jgi:tetratricopeptide (TPR) repeat protein
MPLIHFGLGYFYWEQRLFDQAAAEFQREIDLGGNGAAAMAYLGDIALRKGNPAKALALLQDALRQNPKIRIAHYDLGIVYTKEKKYGQAEKELKRAIAIDPNNADGYYRLAQLYRLEDKGELERAMLAKVARLHESERSTLMDEISGRVASEEQK